MLSRVKSVLLPLHCHTHSLVVTFLLLVAGRSVDATTCRKSNFSGVVSPTRLLSVVFRREDPVYVKPIGVPLSAVSETCCSHSYCNCRATKVGQNDMYDFDFLSFTLILFYYLCHCLLGFWLIYPLLYQRSYWQIF